MKCYLPAPLARSAWLAICLLAPLLLLAQGLQAATRAGAPPVGGGNAAGDKWDPALQAAAARARPDEWLRIIVYLDDKADLAPSSLPAGRTARRAVVVARLQQVAAASQGPLRRQLAAWEQEGRVGQVQPLWIVNAVALRTDLPTIRKLSERPDVSAIHLDQAFHLPDTQIRPDAAPPSVTWGLARIQAPAAWVALGLDGRNVTVAIMDTGVDFTHPDLVANYRGNLGGGRFDHEGHWFNTTRITDTVPADPLGHGTHVAGTAVAANGLGVAPGARWIAVRIFDDHGVSFSLDGHLGFQWLLAPAGDPALAPDIVNNSWGHNNPYLLEFWPDVQALKAAGIIPVFAAGNNGPGPGSLIMPASYTGTLAIGASDESEAVTWFSSRGPSPLTGEVKPTFVAPGAPVLSTEPGGGYGRRLGTSMAAPHASGALALLLSAAPHLDEGALVGLITATAVAPMPGQPDAAWGWGRLNVYRAAQSLVPHGTLRGDISANGDPVHGVTITVTAPAGRQLTTRTDLYGRYSLALLPGAYDLVVGAFDYQSRQLEQIPVNLGATTTRHLTLTPHPSGHVGGFLRQPDGASLTGTVRVAGTPVAVPTAIDGSYQLALPAGAYTLTAASLGSYLAQVRLTVSPGQMQQHDFVLTPAPAVLLVDGGMWFYDSQAPFYRAGLTELGLAFDEWTVRQRYADVPGVDRLSRYDAVLWSSPRASPGLGSVAASQAISDFLGLGGRLLVSGQDIGDFDGAGFGTTFWWHHQLQARWLGNQRQDFVLSPVPGSLVAGLDLTLNGPDSAANQTTPDRVAPRPTLLARPLFTYPSGEAAALETSRCGAYRLLYFGFGLEGVTGAPLRQALLARSVDFLTGPPLSTGVRLLHDPVDEFALPGRSYEYTLPLLNLSETATDTFDLSLEVETLGAGRWTNLVNTPTLSLPPCGAGQVGLTILAPEALALGEVQRLDLVARSRRDPAATGRVTFYHHGPAGDVLLVDDDRWYDVEDRYSAALTAAGMVHDIWEIGWDEDVRGSPPQKLLELYDFVVWFTAYDWFAPLLNQERAALEGYLAQGGRLFLTSQDLLARHGRSQLARDFLGVQSYVESITPTLVLNGEPPTLSSLSAATLLDYGPYQNFSDGLVPAPGSQVALWHDRGYPAGTATAGDGWRSVFWALPFETLPLAQQGPAMTDILSWLSDVGDSTFVVSPRSAPAGITRSYTLTLRAAETVWGRPVTVTNALPPELVLLPGTLTGGAVYEPETHRVRWMGVLDRMPFMITYQARPAPGASAGTRLENVAAIAYDRHDIVVSRRATGWVAAPDLTPSQLLVAPERLAAPARTATYTLALRNPASVPAPAVSATLALGPRLNPVSGTLTSTSGDVGWTPAGARWLGRLEPGGVVTVTLVVTTTAGTQPVWLSAAAIIEDGISAPVVRDSRLFIAPHQRWLPVIAFARFDR